MAYYPYVVQRRQAIRHKRLFKRLFFWFFIIASIMGGGAHYFFFSDIFLIERVEVSGVADPSSIRETVEEYLGKKTVFGLANNNFFFVSPADLQALIAGRFPALASVAATKTFPRLVRLAVKERQYAATWCRTASQNCFIVDTEGVAYAEAQSSSGTLVFLLKSESPHVVGESVLPEAALADLSFVRKALGERFRFTVKEFVIDDLPDTAAQIFGDWTLQFDVSRPVAQTLDALQNVLASADLAGKKIEYIDLRIENRVYYKALPAPSPL